MNDLTKNQKIFLLIFIIIIILILIYAFINFTKDDSETYEMDDLMVNTTNKTNNEIDQVNIPSEKIMVYVIGSVKNPGVVELDVDSRVSDAVNAVGRIIGNGWFN